MKVISWNLLRLEGAAVEDVAALLERERPDVMLMQEVTQHMDALTKLAGGHYSRLPWPGRIHGLAVWSRHNFSTPRVLPLPASRLPGRLPRRRAQVVQLGDITFANVHLSHGQLLNRRQLARIAAALHPRPVIIRMSDFKTNEYANLLGGAQFEGAEENPMIGLRGASRYYSAHYRDGFALECRAIRRLREVLGFRNVLVMIPFCRSPQEADRVLEIMAAQGLRRGVDGLQVYVMCEIPSNVILASEFAARFDGFSIGSNDLTQLTLGVDRDSEELAGLFDEQDAAVLWMIRTVITRAHEAGVKVGLCGQAPSNHPEFARFLVDCGIDSVSVTPDSFVAVKRQVALAEAGAASPAGKST